MSSKSIRVGICILMILFLLPFSYSYKMETGKEVHQHITNESKLAWKQVPFEMLLHANNRIVHPLNGTYNLGVDDIITGSGEEDLGPELAPYLRHFWNPDTPRNGNYDDGLNSPFEFDSSYRRALGYWVTNVIPNYLNGNQNESYYYFGRVAHLLEDASQPSHVLMDCHPDIFGASVLCGLSSGDGGRDDSVLEEYTGNNLTIFQNRYNWSGENFAGKQYYYENLPNMQSFNWREVEPTRPLDRQNIELFRLFWYVAQKTQYFASDDADGNSVYVNLSGNQKTFSPTLWTNDNVTIINNSVDLAADDVYDTGPNVEKETNAVIPHAMKSVAGLYRLFWDAVQVDWKFYHHDLRNTGYTLLKGDITANNKQIWNYSSAPATDFWDEAVIAEIDNNLSDGQEIIVATANSDYTDGRVYALDGKTNKELWSFNDTLAAEPVSVDDVENKNNL